MAVPGLPPSASGGIIDTPDPPAGGPVVALRFVCSTGSQAMKRRLFTTSAVLALVTMPIPAEAAAMSGAWGAVAQAEQEEDEAETPFNCSGADKGNVNVTNIPDGRRLSEVIGVCECWQAKVDNRNFYHLNDLYGRWVVELVDDGGFVRDYKRERHSALSRFFMGRSRGVVMSVRIRMRDPDIEFNVPLVAVDYNGRGRQGEAFVTTLTGSDMALPDVRLSANSSVTIEATGRVADEVDIQPTGIVLSTLRDSLAIAAPGGSLLTAINREQVQRVSSAYDVALSRLLSTSITETVSAGRLMSEWYPGASIIVIVYLPDKIRTSRWGRGDSAEHGADRRRMVFRISMTCPRVSVFDVMNACQQGRGEKGRIPAVDNLKTLIYRTDFAKFHGRPGFQSDQYKYAVDQLAERVSPSQVLNFRLGVGKNIRQYLSEQEWFLALSKQLILIEDEKVKKAEVVFEGDKNAPPAKSQANDTVRAADQFCAAIFDRLYAAGLSRLDSQIGLWAVTTGIGDLATYRSLFQQAPVCRDNLPGNAWTYLPNGGASAGDGRKTG
jgi:hypothetical protein